MYRASGDWSVNLDGAFLATHADGLNGAVLEHAPIEPVAGHLNYSGDVTIVSGCDAQMQFVADNGTRYAVTLQAGAPGGCAFGGGPGQIRLHRDSPNYHEFTAKLLDPPLQVGRPYRIKITTEGQRVVVSLDDDPAALTDIIPETRFIGFTLKAWAGSARFAHVQAYGDRDNGEPVNHDNLGWRAFSQLHGFHDCNNNIAEVTSHGAFLSGLMHTWETRAHTMPLQDRERLRHAIIAADGYLERLNDLFPNKQGYVHREPAHGPIEASVHHAWMDITALYGETAFAAKGKWVDRPLARKACQRVLNVLASFPAELLEEGGKQGRVPLRVPESAPASDG